MAVVDLIKMHEKKLARRRRVKRSIRKAVVVPKRRYVRPADLRSVLNIYAWIVIEALYKVDKHELIRVVAVNATTVVPRVRKVLDLMINDGMVTEDHFGHCMVTEHAYLSAIRGRSFLVNLSGLKSMFMIKQNKKLLLLLERSVERLVVNGQGVEVAGRVVPTEPVETELRKRLGDVG